MLHFESEKGVIPSGLRIFAMKYLCSFEIIASLQREQQFCVHVNCMECNDDNDG